MSALTEYLVEHRIEYKEGGSHRHVRYGWVGVQCPWCYSSAWHLGIREADGFCTCWRCGKHKLGEALMRLTHNNWAGVKNIVFQLTKGRLAYEQKVERPSRVIIPKGVGHLEKAHLRYLKNRRFDPQEIRLRWDVQGIGQAKTHSWRLFIPIIVNGTTVSWTTRAIGDKQPRYLSAAKNQEVLSHKDILYGADLARHTIIVHEGPLDVWATGPGAVAISGLEISPTQVKEISAYPRRIVCFDRSVVARRRADKLFSRLLVAPGVTEVYDLETGDDPAEADQEEIAELRARYLSQ